ncbi:MAG: hypothetical protein ACRERS_04810, partial [Methylococcales bacterium]
MVPEAWERAALHALSLDLGDLFAQAALRTIADFFGGQNLTLPPGKRWRNVSANIFEVVDGKRILFENDNSLFHTLRMGDPSAEVIRENVAVAM